MSEIKLSKKGLIVGIVGSTIVTIALVALLIDIFAKKTEADSPFQVIKEITDDNDNPADWGVNFPHQYASYLKTVDMTKTKYGGSEAYPHTIDGRDTRDTVSVSKIDEDPRLKTMWMGYAFSVDFREERGHAYMLVDQEMTKRQDVVKQPGTCINCHGSTYVAMKKLGEGDIVKGFDKLNSMPYWEAHKLVNHSVSCIDCHTPQTMKLRVTRPAFMEGIKAYKATQGVQDFDVNKMASPQEMRTFVCAQCHVEYYFKGPEKKLVFPWYNGVKADEILSYYESEQGKHKDWEHKITGAPALKAQHPEYELYTQGIHARSGVSCVDCHMPYEKVGAKKITNHQARSPLLSINTSCQTCHKVPEQELKARVENIQDKFTHVRNLTMDALTEYINQLGEARDKKLINEESLKTAQSYQRKAQFLLDFVEAENSTGFHAPEEAMRVLGTSMDYIRKGQQEVLKSQIKK